MMEFILWAVIALIIFSTGVFLSGWETAKVRKTDPNHDGYGDRVIPMALVVAAAWPIVLGLLPFAGLYYLGRHLGKNA